MPSAIQIRRALPELKQWLGQEVRVLLISKTASSGFAMVENEQGKRRIFQVRKEASDLKLGDRGKIVLGFSGRNAQGLLLHKAMLGLLDFHQN